MARPKLAVTKISKSVTLNESTLDDLTALGKGNLSQGIETAYQGYMIYRMVQNMGPIIPPETKSKKKK